ncbi:Type 1 fimbriae regulatory protein FimE (plasmid) [Planktothrix agardhii]|nr:Type 1 fimbriae regulatory protein FimE [Planktothrix agardhii]
MPRLLGLTALFAQLLLKRPTRSIRNIIARAGEIAQIAFPVHPHQLRHACGYYLAAQGHDTRAIQDYLGHKNIHHTVRYTQMSPQRFEKFWRD